MSFHEAHSASPISLGLQHHRAGHLREAEKLYRTALAAAPEDPVALNGLGLIAHQAGRHVDAEKLIRRALQSNCTVAVWCNLGVVLKAQGRVPEALSAYHAALNITPDFVDAWYNLGILLAETKKTSEAIRAYTEVLRIAPDHHQARWNRSLALLASGDYLHGWPEYEVRWRRQDKWSLDRHLPQPRWQGEDIAGQTLLVCAEQGMGDTIQFVRYVPMLVARGISVVLEVPAPLIRLLRRMHGVAGVVEQGGPLPSFDKHCLMMSLPALLGTRLNSIPTSVPYLTPEAGQVQAWRDRLAGDARLKVGLVWAGAPRPHQPDAAAIDRRRSIALDSYLPLAAVPNVRWISLQKGEPSRQACRPPAGMVVEDWSDELTDFQDTAALIANLDLVITVDTSVAHLAGALGKQVWILSRYDGCWRWLQGRDDSPWYQTATLFHQENRNEWSSTIERVRNRLMHVDMRQIR